MKADFVKSRFGKLCNVRFLAGAVIAALAAFSASGVSAASVWINEFHYDNVGTDTGEAIEIAGTAGTDLTGWSLVRYNGATGQVYTTPAANPAGSDVLSGTIPDLGGGFGVVVVNYLADGIQNGAPDGIALVDSSSAVVQFLSYEGSFTAINGPASGLTSTDVGVAESGTTPVGYSLQLTGSGSSYADFSWAAAQASTFGAVNTGQSFVPLPPAVWLFGSGLLGLIGAARRRAA
jgi:hypothetical protein